MRKIKEEDLEQICQIEKEVFSDPWSLEMFQTCNETYRCWLLENKSEQLIIGYLMGEKVIDEFSIYNLAIRKHYQRQGHGIMFTKKIIDLMILEGCRKFFLEVRSGNQAARFLYQKLGFIEIYKRKHYYCNPVEDALVMMLDINKQEG